MTTNDIAPSPEPPPAPSFDLASLLGGLLSRGTGGSDTQPLVHALDVLFGVIQTLNLTLREERLERGELRRRVDKLQELLERAKLDARAGDYEAERSLTVLRAGFAAEMIRALGLDPDDARQHDVFSRIRELRLKAGELEPPKVPPVADPILLDQPPDRGTPGLDGSGLKV